MASQFKNSNLAYYLYASIVVIIGLVSIFAFWFMITGFNIGNYSENTVIGSVYIGGKDEQQAEDKLRTSIEEWLEDDEVVFEARYQGYSYVFDRDLLFFDIDRSLEDIQDGQQNTLYVSYSETALAELLSEFESEVWMSDLQDVFDLDTLIDDILVDAAGMKLYSSKQLNNYFISDNLNEPLYLTSIEVPETYDGQPLNAELLMDKLNTLFEDGRVQINAKSYHSVLDTFDNSFTRAEMSFISSMLLEVIPYTPFTIDERGVLVQDFEEAQTLFGRNVVVQRTYGIDFSFENNTYCDFEIGFVLSGQSMNIVLYGMGMINDITVHTNIETVEYGTQTTTNPDNVRDGRDGYIIQVFRTVTDVYDNETTTEVIFERYDAISAVVLVEQGE